VPSIFTDEPQFAHKSRLSRSTDDRDLFLPWTKDLSDTFRASYGYDIWNALPGILWDTVPRDSSSGIAVNDHTHTTHPETAVRYHFHDHVCELFVSSFMDVVANWCKTRNIALIGHMMKEPTLLSQTEALGEAMRCYRNLEMPGVDMLCDALEYNTVKQAASVARQNGSLGVMSEIYGVTNWTFDFEGHKASGDWQAALGITFRVHHLTWVGQKYIVYIGSCTNVLGLQQVSMAGEGKRDYPACIGYQSPWYKEYKYVEDHFSRLNVALTRGRPRVRVAVIHPIESFWLCYGPMDTSGAEASFREQAFESLTSWLLFSQIDFDFISESLLPDQTALDDITPGSLFPVGCSKYEVIIVPNLKTIRFTTLERLERFSSCGGKVLFAGTLPSLVNGVGPLKLDLQQFSSVPWTEFHIISALETHRDVRVTCKDDGVPARTMLYQMREEEDDTALLFICNTHRKRYFPTEIAIRGEWTPTVLDTLSGERWYPHSTYSRGWTHLDWHFEACGSVLFNLTPSREQVLITSWRSDREFTEMNGHPRRRYH